MGEIRLEVVVYCFCGSVGGGPRGDFRVISRLDAWRVLLRRSSLFVFRQLGQFLCDNSKKSQLQGYLQDPGQRAVEAKTSTLKTQILPGLSSTSAPFERELQAAERNRGRSWQLRDQRSCLRAETGKKLRNF